MQSCARPLTATDKVKIKHSNDKVGNYGLAFQYSTIHIKLVQYYGIKLVCESLVLILDA